MTVVHRNAQPFYYESQNGITCLLIHGFTGSPSEIRPLGEYLKERGYGVKAILLPGHGTSPEEMARTTWQDWFAAVEHEYLSLQQNCPTVVPIGFSMGGLLSLHLASQYPVPRVAALSCPVFIGNRRAYLAPFLQYFYAFREKPVPPSRKEEDLAAGHFAYYVTPVKCLTSLLQLIKKVKQELPYIKTPVLFMQSWKDGTVNPRSAQYLYEKIGSAEKKLVWLEKSGHLIILGMEREQVFKAVDEFLQDLGKPGGGAKNNEAEVFPDIPDRSPQG